MTLSSLNSGLSVAGSSRNTSRAAPATFLAISASASAASSIRPPRAQLMIRTPGFILARASAEMMFLVASISGVCSVMKSARRSRSSSSTFSTPRSTARSAVRNGSKAMTFILSPMARSATIEPILPQPMMPSTLPVTSTPMKRFFSHLPARVEASASGIWRASDSMSEMACSAVVMELPKGVFITMMPFLVAAGMSTLSTPMPARPITFRLSAAAMIFSVILLAERMARPSYLPITSSSFSLSLPRSGR